MVVIILLTIRGDILFGFLNFRHHGELNPGQMGLGLACLSFELTPLPACWIEPVLISHPLNQRQKSFNYSVLSVQILALLLDYLFSDKKG